MKKTSAGVRSGVMRDLRTTDERPPRLRFPRGFVVLDRRERRARRRGRRPLRGCRRYGARRGGSPRSCSAEPSGAGIGFGIESWQPGGWGDRSAGIAGGVAGALGAAPDRRAARSARRRPASARQLLVAGAALVVAALAWIPVVGYLDGARAAGSRARGCGGRSPSGTPVCGRSRGTSSPAHAEEARPDRRRRDDARRRSSARSRAAARRRSPSSPSTATTGRRPRSSRRSRRSASPRSRPAPGPASTTSPRSSGGTGRSAGSSSTARRSPALRAAGLSQSLLDTIFNMNARHLSPRRDDDLRGARGRRASSRAR